MRQVNQDLEHLKLLSIFYYILAGLSLLPAAYGVFYAVMGLFFGAVAFSADTSGGAAPAVLGGVFVIIGLVIVVIALTVGMLLLKAGRNLSKQQGYTFCFVVACIICLFMPLGTILGIFSIIVLMRDSVKALFNGQNYPQPPHPSNWQ